MSVDFLWLLLMLLQHILYFSFTHSISDAVCEAVDNDELHVCIAGCCCCCFGWILNWLVVMPWPSRTDNIKHWLLSKRKTEKQTKSKYVQAAATATSTALMCWKLNAANAACSTKQVQSKCNCILAISNKQQTLCMHLDFYFKVLFILWLETKIRKKRKKIEFREKLCKHLHWYTIQLIAVPSDKFSKILLP